LWLGKSNISPPGVGPSRSTWDRGSDYASSLAHAYSLT
jgi:hypothetical protein